MKTRLISIALLMWPFILYGHDLPVKQLLESNKQTHIVKNYDLGGIEIAKEYYFRAQFTNYDIWFATHFPNLVDRSFRADHVGMSHMTKRGLVNNTNPNPNDEPFPQHPIIDPLNQMIAALGSETDYNDRDGISQGKANQINILIGKMPSSNDHYVIAAMVGLSICNATSSVDISNPALRLIPKFIGPQSFLDGSSRDPSYVSYHIRDGLKFQCVYQTEGFILNKPQYIEYKKFMRINNDIKQTNLKKIKNTVNLKRNWIN